MRSKAMKKMKMRSKAMKYDMMMPKSEMLMKGGPVMEERMFGGGDDLDEDDG